VKQFDSLGGLHETTSLYSSESDVSEFIHGRHEIFPALEQKVVGMKPEEKKKVEPSPAEGFGPYDEGKRINIEKALLPPGAKEGDVVQNDVDDFIICGGNIR